MSTPSDQPPRAGNNCVKSDEQIQAWIDSADWTYLRRPCPRCGRYKGFYGFRLWCGDCRASCDHGAVVYGRIITINGSHQYRSLCLTCGDLKDEPKSAPQGPWVFKDSRDHQTVEPCARCGSKDGSELHHWAPSAIFWDAHDWPTSYLCRECHRTWHQYMRKAGGYRLDGDDRHGAGLRAAQQEAWAAHREELQRMPLLERLRRGYA